MVNTITVTTMKQKKQGKKVSKVIGASLIQQLICCGGVY